MAQSSPTSILYGQALALINSFKRQYSALKDGDPVAISESVSSIMAKYENSSGSALTEFNPIVHSEIPSSAKMNRFFGGLQTDINLIEDQLDVLRSSAISSHNMVKTDILKAKEENKRLQNKLKTLELYSNINDDSLIYFSDSFISEDLIDWSLTSESSERSHMLSKGNISLAISSIEDAIDNDSTVYILEGSNGFLGNNQEIDDIQNPQVDPVSHQKLFIFKSEMHRHASLTDAIDGNPISWIEFEKYLVPAEDRTTAKNFNFTYSLTNSEDTQYLTGQSDVQVSNIQWANGPSGGVLKLILEIDLQISKQINVINLTPFGLVDNINNPIKVSKVSVSSNRNDWTVINPQNVWIVNSIDRKISFLNSENINIGSASWNTPGEWVQYIRFEIEQPQPVDCNIGHLYYVSKDSDAINTPNYGTQVPETIDTSLHYDEAVPYNAMLHYGGTAPSVAPGYTGYQDNIIINDDATPTSYYHTQLQDVATRVEGPTPKVDNPGEFYGVKRIFNDLFQKVEYFRGKRWVIGLRDIEVKTTLFKSKSVLVSKLFNLPGLIDRVSLEADVYIPPSFTGSDWIKFYISPNNGLNWFRISRIQDNFNGIPEIIAFNDPTHPDMREPGVSYYDVSGSVNSIRLKIEMSRPDGIPYLSPIIKSYKLKIIKRSK